MRQSFGERRAGSKAFIALPAMDVCWHSPQWSSYEKASAYSNLLLSLASFSAHSQPSLSVQLLDRQNLQVSWPATATGLVLEQTPALPRAANWQAIDAAPVLQNDRFTVKLPISWLRSSSLHQAAASLISIIGTSPADGETGAAVTRETIVHFSGTPRRMLSSNNFYQLPQAKDSSRIELSSDRTKATLFYLEPLLGSARQCLLRCRRFD
jgi:hypothetical protein